jgi:beta-aspartyl-peptidase (threonine type)
MKLVISKQVCDLVAAGLTAQEACDAAIKLLEERVNGRGGLISIDTEGRVGIAFNTRAMPHAYAVEQGTVFSGR